MKWLLSFFLLFAVMGAWASDPAPAQITIGMIPGGNPENLRAQALDMAKSLQTQLNIPVNIYISKDYAGLVEAMKNKKADFAFFSSMTYVFAEKDAKAKVLLKKIWNEPYYYSALIVRKDSKIQNISQLKGKTIAFVDENSSSGYLYPQAMLKKKKINAVDFFKSIVFSGNHQASVKMLEESKVDAVAVFSDDAKGNSGAWVKFALHHGIKYRVLWVSEPIPNDPFCVRQDFYDQYPKITHTLMFDLIDLAADNIRSRRYSEVLGAKDLMPATSRQYEPVREMVESMRIQLK